MSLRSRWSLSLLPALLVGCASSAPPPPQPITTGPAPTAKPAEAPAPEAVPLAAGGKKGIDESALDRSVNACDNFYEFACGGWNKSNAIPDDQSSWFRSFSAIHDRNELALKETLEKYSKTPSDTPYAKQLGDFYAACMDEDAIEKNGVSGLKDELARIDAINDTKGLIKEIGRLHTEEVNAAFGFGADIDAKNSGMMIGEFGQGGLGLPDRDYYFRDDAKSKEIREKYEPHVAKMLTFLDPKHEKEMAKAAKVVVALETKLATASMTAVELRDPQKTYNKIDLAGLEAKSPAVDWKLYLTEIGAPGVKDINVAQPEFAAALSTLFKSVPMKDWKTYLRWHLIDALGPTLNKAVVDERFAFIQLLSGAKVIPPRWKRCTRMVDHLMGEALAIPFVKEHLGEEGKQAARRMVADIEQSMKQNLSLLPWMDDATRSKAQEKLSLVDNMIGYPDKWKTYDGLVITRDSYAKDVMAATAYEEKRDLAKIGKPVDRSEWEMTPPTVNAYYHPLHNQMVFPAGILQPPFYSNDFLDAVNFGAIGLIVGHELTHGFDDQGRQFDAHGNLQDWWSPNVNTEFDKRAACVEKQFDDYIAVDEVHVNGKLTLGENIADLGGLKLSHNAFKRVHPANEKTGSFTDEQQFFLGFAQSWCGNIRPQQQRVYAQTDGHSPAVHRVNGPLSNMPEFAKAFSCSEGSKMVRPAATRCEVW